ncbi:hypothetical protein NTE_00141 [Candidatus Nitrososphaera evergladensis SR1]|jgi:hypothetical protein|uniref:Uncharacterized protein n=1 Tax=Candidatus Nitrososphaera evergladensis SR1 TaxID=1459636 RepID=A0A075MLV9_9ARCH|nr:hypothetical protein NTE_00141 [Candidatus Nitrososphaera evergladensis SR1]
MENVGSKGIMYMDSICTCKTCNHKLTKNCIEASCSCCTEENHSMVLDGIEGFAPLTNKKEKKEAKRNARAQKRLR